MMYTRGVWGPHTVLDHCIALCCAIYIAIKEPIKAEAEFEEFVLPGPIFVKPPSYSHSYPVLIFQSSVIMSDSPEETESSDNSAYEFLTPYEYKTTTLGKTFTVPGFYASDVGTYTVPYTTATTISSSAYISTTTSSGVVYYYSFSGIPLTTSVSSYEVIYHVNTVTVKAVSIIQSTASPTSTSPSAFSTSLISSSGPVSSTTFSPTTATAVASGSPEPAQPINNSHTSAGVIAGGVIGGLAGVSLAVGGVICYFLRRKRSRSKEEMQEVSQVG